MSRPFGSFHARFQCPALFGVLCVLASLAPERAIPQTLKTVEDAINSAGRILGAETQKIAPQGPSIPSNNYVVPPPPTTAVPGQFSPGPTITISPPATSNGPVTLNPDTVNDVSKLQPPSATGTSNIQPSSGINSYSSPSTFPAASNPIIATAAPGGISLSRAAAAAMPINIAVDGAYYKDGRLVLSGRPGAGLDAALVLTSLRLACESGDPYFSLDPDNGGAWLEQGERAFQILWQQVKQDIGWQQPVPANRASVGASALDVRTIWARRDYPQIWTKLSQDFPDLKSRLVFQPEWLDQTRFGEILYKADVLLKEISSGVSILEPGALRAEKLVGYAPELMREDAKNLFAAIRNENLDSKWKGSRFWFDIAPRSSNPAVAFDGPTPNSTVEQALFRTVKERGMMPPKRVPSQLEHKLVRDGDALDMSKVFPTMFVRRRDIGKGVDIPDDDPVMNSFSSDVNDDIEGYVAHYHELQALTEVIRAYVLAVHIVSHGFSNCPNLANVPLLDSEKTSQPLPAYQPSELIISVARFAYGNGRAVQTFRASSTLIQGGVTIAGKKFVSDAVSDITSNITRTIGLEVTQHWHEASWAAPESRRYISFSIDVGEARAQDSQDLRPPAPPNLPTPQEVYAQLSHPNSATDATASPSHFPIKQSHPSIFAFIGVSAILLFLSRWISGKRRRQIATASTSAKIIDERGRYADGAWAMPDQSRDTSAPRAQRYEDAVSEAEATFNNVFSTKSAADRERIIKRYMTAKTCNRDAAIRYAVDEWRKDNRSWRH